MRNKLYISTTHKRTASSGSLLGSHRGQWLTAIRCGVAGFMMVNLSLFFGAFPAPAASSVPAPKFQLQTLSGEPYSKASLQGRPTLLVFWAPWCRYCQMELPILAKFYQGNKPDQLQVLTVAFSDSLAHVEEYVSANPDTFIFPTAYDQENEVAQAFGVNVTPTFVVMNAQGEMILAHRGAGINQNPQYQKFLESLNP
ncbi:TlpA family protein disulfide reductase [Candidatus Nitrospira allomarina]|uniref:TlpA disulfide reductase family protein n=1 Tax=Candidatus Nitrospira allomarina TaxID=3020900 RepID=A0AA96G830_9BACT|nr:TlpA disulfide reductase family protein [Candidatus Nitrospira allomarina]WNM56462.1 TlpA disulfide reductase family protein [Candidatus Nitrospira allomarina]